LWSVLLAAAVLWPSRLAGPLDGAPLDTTADALVIGLIVPALVALDRRILKRRMVRGLIVVLLAWKAMLAVSLVQDGWCLRFTSPVPLFVNQERVPHAWDIRADWRSDPPRCSAVMTRGYESIDRFPVWFYNLPPANFSEAARAHDRPPLVTVAIDVDGFIQSDRSGVLRIVSGTDVRLSARIDDEAVEAAALAAGVTVAPGTHAVALNGSASGERWALLAHWNGEDVWTSATATMTAPRAVDKWARPWARWVTPLLIAWLLWCAAGVIVRRVGDPTVIIISVSTTAVAALAGGRGMVARLVPIIFAAAAFVRIPRRLQNIHGAQLLIGVPFLALIAARGLDDIGRVTWYTSGDDWWVFQRFAYRIYLQGYWLEGGEPAFWFQPFYRWIAGALHMIFGDTSVGELYWDGASALAGALFSFHVTRSFANFRWALVAGMLTVLLMSGGPAWYLFGRGLSELTSSGLIYMAALWTLRGRSSQKRIMWAALCIMAAFYTRLNSLPFAIAVIAFSLPLNQQAGDWFRWRQWWPRVSRPAFTGLVVAIAVALVLFSLRSYYFTGRLNAFAGTQAGARSVWQPTGTGESTVQNVVGSVLLVLTMNDDRRADPRAIPIWLGLSAAALALCGVRGFRVLPLNVALLALAGIAGAFVARGSAYPGRFSVHLIPVTVALTVCSIAWWTGHARGSAKNSRPASPTATSVSNPLFS
jgi:hypothetical protein